MDSEALLSSSYTSGQISFSGLGSGTDFASMVDKLVQLERRHMARLEIWKAEWETKKTGLQELNAKLLSLRTNLQNINTMSKFLVKDAESTDQNVLSATADDKAQVGTHRIEVNQLAQAHILAGTTTQTSTKTDITGSTAQLFDYSYAGGSTISISVPAGTTLEGLRNLINTDPDNPGVRASIIKTGDNAHILQLRGMDLGEGKDVTIAATTTVSGYGTDDFITSQTAQNSQIKVDGYPPGADWIERSTNTISDLLEGVTISLRDIGTVTLNIAVDEEAVKDNVREFVDQVNEVRSKIKELTQVVGESRGSILTGNYGIQMVDSRLKSILAVKGLGFDVDNDVFSSLGMVGITTDSAEGSPSFGLLKLDEEILDHALKNRPDELAQLFAADYIGTSNSSDFRYYSSVNGVTKAGEYTVKYTVSGGVVTSATINGNPADISDTDEITGRSGNPEAGLAVKIDNLADGTFEGKVFLKLGKATEMADALKDLTSTSTGPLHIIKDNYKDITESIDRKIEYEERRVERYEQDLRDRFARLEALLKYYDSLGESINSQLGQLKSDSSK
ncbi:MAG TPA: flagellar hook-associated protein [Desulfonatronum sp.]|nr:flagellar hook-associated protein [Desulfonatronum sp.]